MRIVSYNMRQGGSAAHWEAILGELRPDLLFAQEANDPSGWESLFVSLPGERLCWRCARPGRWGSALLLPSAELERLEVPGYAGWVVGAEIPNLPWAESGHPLRVFSVHVPSGPGSYVGQADRILDAIAGLPGPADVLLAGDFNLTVSRGESGLPRRENPAVLRLLDRLQDQFGLVSAWEAANPGSLLPQTLRWARDPTAPYHCDGIFMPRSWVHRLARVSVVAGDAWSVRSDHNPVLVELED